MCPATSPSHSDMNQHCHVSTDLISFAHRAVFNPKVSSFVALYSNTFVIQHNVYLFNVIGVKKMKWSLVLMRSAISSHE